MTPEKRANYLVGLTGIHYYNGGRELIEKFTHQIHEAEQAATERAAVIAMSVPCEDAKNVFIAQKIREKEDQ